MINPKFNLTDPVFISGKISGLPTEQMKAKFRSAKQYLISLGFSNIFSPPEEIDQALPYEFQMEICIEEVKKRKIVYQLPDWGDSDGAREECACAMENNKIITNYDNITRYVRDHNKDNSNSNFSMDNNSI